VAAGTYNDVHARPRNDIETTGVVTQVVYISRTVTVRGGYTTANGRPLTRSQSHNPGRSRPGRVLYVAGNISPTIEGLRVTGGNAGKYVECWHAG